MLHRIKEMLCDELEKYAGEEKINSANELDQIDKLTHALKCVETIMAMKGGAESESGGASYARGRSMRTGRYISRDDGMGGNGYPSRDPYMMDRRY